MRTWLITSGHKACDLAFPCHRSLAPTNFKFRQPKASNGQCDTVRPEIHPSQFEWVMGTLAVEMKN